MSRVLALVDDLLFLSRIREAASGAGVEVRTVRGPEALVSEVRSGGRLVLVDADSSRLPWVDAVTALRADGSDDAVPTVPVVAFFSHVNTENAERARAAGCDRVVPRGSFVSELPTLLSGLGAPTSSGEETPS